MDFEELYEELLNQNEQADRSVTLANLRDQVNAVVIERDSVLAKNAELEEQNLNYVTRNSELYLKIRDQETKPDAAETASTDEVDLKTAISTGMFSN